MQIKSKIEAKITASKRYRSGVHPSFTKDFEILKNPDYTFDFAKIFLAALLSLFISLIVSLIINKKNSKQIIQLKVQLNILNKKIDSQHSSNPILRK